MSKYQCCQGYFNCCCIKAGTLGEESCPDLCLCLESFLCSNLAVSASRMYVMDKYALSSDPCDYRLIRLKSNMLQLLACVCDLAACITENNDIRELARIIDHIADLMFHIVSGCMTAQTALEVDYQIKKERLSTQYSSSGYGYQPSETGVGMSGHKPLGGEVGMPFMAQAQYIPSAPPVYNPIVIGEPINKYGQGKYR